jgi:hypothetical protein
VALHAVRGTRSSISETDLSRLEEHAAKHVQTLAWLCDAEQKIPLVGDDDAGIILPRGSDWDVRDCLEVFSFAAELGLSTELPQGIRLWPQQGMAAAHWGSWHVHAVAGAPRGAARGASHRHLDMLSVCISHQATPILIDPGTGTYFANQDWRDYFRSERVHPGIHSGETAWAVVVDLFEVRQPPLGELKVEGKYLLLTCEHPTGGHPMRRISAEGTTLVIEDSLDLPTPRISFPFSAAAEVFEREGDLVLDSAEWRITIQPAPISFSHLVADIELRALETSIETIEGAISTGYGRIEAGNSVQCLYAQNQKVVTTIEHKET